MYLSKLVLHPRSREARRDLSSPYDLHRTLARAFVTAEGEDYRVVHGVLFRVEPVSPFAEFPAVLVQSRTEPDWHELPEEYLYDASTRPCRPEMAEGQTWAFRLVANPTRKMKVEGKKNGRRVPLPDYSATEETTPARKWLLGKGERHGFKVVFLTTRDFWLNRKAEKQTFDKRELPLYGVSYEGLLQVTNAGLLQDALQHGIGPAKAFGFGLLSLARP